MGGCERHWNIVGPKSDFSLSFVGQGSAELAWFGANADANHTYNKISLNKIRQIFLIFFANEYVFVLRKFHFFFINTTNYVQDINIICPNIHSSLHSLIYCCEVFWCQY